jgi:hypothetical protein
MIVETRSGIAVAPTPNHGERHRATAGIRLPERR